VGDIIEELARLREVYNTFDNAATILSKQIQVPLCAEGCGKCCIVTIAHRVEAVYAVGTSLGLGLTPGLLERAEGWLLEHHKEAPTYAGPVYGTPPQKIAQEFYALLSTPCPFLSTDKSCMIYHGRALVCRAYGVTHAPGPTSSFCPRKFGTGESITQRAYYQNPGLKVLVDAYFREIHDDDLVVSGMFPTLIFKQMQPVKFRNYLANGKIASAKILGLPKQFPGLLWQEDVESDARVTAAVR